MIVLRISLFAAILTIGAAAHAQPKRDILGFFLGMTKPEFLKNAEARGLNACRWGLDPDAGLEGRSRETSPWMQIFACPDKSRYKMWFTRNLTPNLLKDFSYYFTSTKTFGGVEEDVTAQFGVKPKKVLLLDMPIAAVYDLGDGIRMSLEISEGQYTLGFQTIKFDAEDRNAGDARKNSTAPRLKF